MESVSILDKDTEKKNLDLKNQYLSDESKQQYISRYLPELKNRIYAPKDQNLLTFSGTSSIEGGKFPISFRYFSIQYDEEGNRKSLNLIFDYSSKKSVSLPMISSDSVNTGVSVSDFNRLMTSPAVLRFCEKIQSSGDGSKLYDPQLKTTLCDKVDDMLNVFLYEASRFAMPLIEQTNQEPSQQVSLAISDFGNFPALQIVNSSRLDSSIPSGCRKYDPSYDYAGEFERFSSTVYSLTNEDYAFETHDEEFAKKFEKFLENKVKSMDGKNWESTQKKFDYFRSKQETHVKAEVSENAASVQIIAKTDQTKLSINTDGKLVMNCEQKIFGFEKRDVEISPLLEKKQDLAVTLKFIAEKARSHLDRESMTALSESMIKYCQDKGIMKDVIKNTPMLDKAIHKSCTSKLLASIAPFILKATKKQDAKEISKEEQNEYLQANKADCNRIYNEIRKTETIKAFRAFVPAILNKIYADKSMQNNNTRSSVTPAPAIIKKDNLGMQSISLLSLDSKEKTTERESIGLYALRPGNAYTVTSFQHGSGLEGIFKSKYGGEYVFDFDVSKGNWNKPPDQSDPIVSLTLPKSDIAAIYEANIETTKTADTEHESFANNNVEFVLN